jgi:hypothetical protein
MDCLYIDTAIRGLSGDGRVETKLREQLSCQLLEFIRWQREYLIEHALMFAFAAKHEPDAPEGDSIVGIQPYWTLDPFPINPSAVGGTQILEQPAALDISKTCVPSRDGWIV